MRPRSTAKTAHAVTIDAPIKTEGWKKEYPLNIIFRTATDGNVNGIQYDKYCKTVGIPCSGQNIPIEIASYESFM